jgi:microcin C transport system permease protein
MGLYITKRLLLIVPTLFGILAINFFVAHMIPGGPVEQMISRALGAEDPPISKEGFSKNSWQGTSPSHSKWRGAESLDPRIVRRIEEHLGFDKPIFERFWITLQKYAQFDFGKSYFQGRPVGEILLEKIPVSLSLGLWSTLIIYGIAIPLGIRKALRHGSLFDAASSTLIIISYAIPSLLVALLLLIFFAGGSFWTLFPLKGIVSADFVTLTPWQKILDHAWHMVLPTLALVIVGIANQSLLMKNSFMEELSKHYVLTARAKGCSESRILYGHILKNACIILVANLPATLSHMLFSGSIIIEIVFNLDGIGLLGFNAAQDRDYPVVLGTLYLLCLAGIILHIIGDILYALIDPRIQFEKRH